MKFRKKEKLLILLFTIITGSLVIIHLRNFIFLEINKSKYHLTDIPVIDIVENENKIEEIVLSFAGDCTLGYDNNYSYINSFDYVFNKNNKDYSYFFKGVKNIFEKDDLTIVNLETTFTNSTSKRDTTFNFKGNPSYTKILTEGSVEVTNIANNHIYDYSEEGYNDTINALKESNISYYGYNNYLIKEIKGVKIGFAGFTRIGNTKHSQKDIKKAMQYFDDSNVDIKIVTFHWGTEKDYNFSTTQEALGKQAIDAGADLVVGHHPHVIQGIQKYKDKYIVYSLGNFVFGGNRNPSDKDAIIFQKIYQLENSEIVNSYIKIIPVSISSKSNINNFQPVILRDTKKNDIINKINKLSKNFVYKE